MNKILIGLSLTFLIIVNAFSQVNSRLYYEAYHVEESPIINGDLSDEAWGQNDWEGGFTQHFPYEGRQPSQPTEFKICFDNSNIYVAIKAYDSSPDSIVNRMSRRDAMDGDRVLVIFDSYHDLRTGFTFGINSSGVRFDKIISDDGNNEDDSWDPIWQAKSRIHDWGWAAEMKIPFTQLRFKKNSKEVWGLIIARHIFRHDESSYWPEIPRDAPGFIYLAGEIGGLEEVEPHKQFDIIPYGVVSYNTYEAVEGNPFMTGADPEFKAGLDAKIGVTNNLTLDLTILPDFGQVEADPSQVNLTAFETFFEEKRPFFIEGSNITSFNVGLGDGDAGNDNLFYSRRIGRRPHGYPSLEDNEYADTPTFTNILGAAKLTGKTKNGVSVGFMESVTAEVKADIDSAGQRTTDIIEPLSNYSLARVQKDFNKGNTIIGGAVTSTIRRLDDTGIDYLHKNATTGGIDFTQYFKDRNYMINTSIYMSHVEGSAEAISITQRSSARYYQRPDADYLEYDESRTSLTGFGGKLEAGKIGGKWFFLFMSKWKSPGLEINDMGYQREADNILNCLWTGYNFIEPFSIFRNLNINNDVYFVNDFGGNFQGLGYEWNVNADFKNFWSTSTGGGFGLFNKSNKFLRGGSSMYLPNNWRYRLFLSSDTRKKVSFFSGVFLNGMAENLEFSISYDLGIIIRPLNTLRISLIPNYSVRTDEFQYVTGQPMNDEDRYIFGKIDQKAFGMSLRINYNITPDLTIQYWGQPFIATGEYSKFKMITDPKADELSDRYHEYSSEQISLDDDYYSIDEDTDLTTDYGFDNPDFNVDEWLSNLVVRWEFLPGSTAYFVWSQSRDYYSQSGEFELWRNIRDLFTARKAYNTILVKLSFRIGLR